jgi:hypothetical protein
LGSEKRLPFEPHGGGGFLAHPQNGLVKFNPNLVAKEQHQHQLELRRTSANLLLFSKIRKLFSFCFNNRRRKAVNFHSFFYVLF